MGINNINNCEHCNSPSLFVTLTSDAYSIDESRYITPHIRCSLCGAMHEPWYNGSIEVRPRVHDIQMRQPIKICAEDHVKGIPWKPQRMEVMSWH